MVSGKSLNMMVFTILGSGELERPRAWVKGKSMITKIHYKQI